MNKLSFWEKLRAYRLTSNFIVLLTLIATFLICVIAYLYPPIHRNEVYAEIVLAFATSLLASVFCLASDIYVKYKDCTNDRFLGDLQSFGIKSLHFNKQQILSELLKECDKEFWISGYRLIMTANLTKDIEEAMSKRIKVKVLLCPPWFEAYRLMYGKSDRIMDNYCKVFSALRRSMNAYGNQCEVRFTERPLLSDTYKVDYHIIAGPYMHNEDKEHGKITANDFFTYDLVKKSRLNNLLSEEYEMLFENAKCKLSWELFDAQYDDIMHGDYRESERVAKMSALCVPVEEPNKA